MESIPSVLIVSPCPTHPANAGSRRRMLGLAVALRELGFRPELLYTDFMDGDLAAMREWWGSDLHFHPYRPGSLSWKIKRWLRKVAPEGTARRRLLQRANITSQPSRPGGAVAVRSPDDYYDSTLDAPLGRLLKERNYAAVIVEYVIMSRAIVNCEAPLRTLLDTHEVFALGNAGETAPMEKNWLHIDAQGELEALGRAAIVIAIQDNDADTLRRSGLPRVITFGHPVEVVKTPDIASAQASNKILFVSGGHPFDVDGLRWFADEVYPLVKSWLAPENIWIAGGIKDSMTDKPPFHFLGRVADLSALYQQVRTVMAPVRQGTGLKIKVVEALGQAKALVSTEFAVRGMKAQQGNAWLAADSPGQFAEALKRAMTDDSVCGQLMSGARQFAVDWNICQKKSLYSAITGKQG